MRIETTPDRPELHVTRNNGNSFSIVQFTSDCTVEKARIRLRHDECLALADGIVDVIESARQETA